MRNFDSPRSPSATIEVTETAYKRAGTYWYSEPYQKPDGKYVCEVLERNAFPGMVAEGRTAKAAIEKARVRVATELQHLMDDGLPLPKSLNPHCGKVTVTDKTAMAVLGQGIRTR